jgi:membrane-associated protein
MNEFWTTLSHLIDAEALLKSGGFYLLLFIVFAETGLFFGFFLPGDYLLFLSGLFVASGMLDTNIYILCSGLIVAAVAGNFVGYVFGRRAGPMLFKREDSLLFKKKYVIFAEEFYHKYGAVAIILGRFLPIIRTFAPIFAGIVKVDFKKFVLYNILGALLWVLTLTLAGYFLGKEFPQIINYIEYIVIGFIVIATSPIVYAFIKAKFRKH